MIDNYNIKYILWSSGLDSTHTILNTIFNNYNNYKCIIQPIYYVTKRKNTTIEYEALLKLQDYMVNNIINKNNFKCKLYNPIVIDNDLLFSNKDNLEIKNKTIAYKNYINTYRYLHYALSCVSTYFKPLYFSIEGSPPMRNKNNIGRCRQIIENAGYVIGQNGRLITASSDKSLLNSKYSISTYTLYKDFIFPTIYKNKYYEYLDYKKWGLLNLLRDIRSCRSSQKDRLCGVCGACTLLMQYNYWYNDIFKFLFDNIALKDYCIYQYLKYIDGNTSTTTDMVYTNLNKNSTLYSDYFREYIRGNRVKIYPFSEKMNTNNFKYPTNIKPTKDTLAKLYLLKEYFDYLESHKFKNIDFTNLSTRYIMSLAYKHYLDMNILEDRKERELRLATTEFRFQYMQL